MKEKFDLFRVLWIHFFKWLSINFKHSGIIIFSILDLPQ
ncbi:hypothetical protein M8044_000540, partial [Columbia Basin potato purple top phytoplasma]|nr:hypothetical protein [Columbia Basin potato purple top phytoplasma]